MTDPSKIFSLRAGLLVELKEEFWYRDQPTTLPEFIALLKRADIKMRAHQADTRRPHGSTARRLLAPLSPHLPTLTLPPPLLPPAPHP